MDEESLFRDIHRHLLKQARTGEHIDTELRLADRFNVSRHYVRRALETLTQMGVVTRTQKRGISFTTPEPEQISKQLESKLKVSGFDPRELSEARQLFDTALLSLTTRRIAPASLGVLSDTLQQMEGCLEFRGAALKLHQRFWEIIFESAGNRVLQVFANSLLINAMNTLENHMDDLTPEWYSDMLDCDRDVLQALRRNNLDAAQRVVSDWLNQAFDFD